MSLISWFGNVFSKKSYLYGSSGRYSEDLTNQPKWIGMLQRHRLDMANRHVRAASNPKFREWLNFIESIKAEDTMEKLHRVNDWTNTTGYVTDPRNWRESDYWATPYEFFAKGGDCEDYATAKYMALRMLGMDMKDLRLVVLNDTHKRAMHAILAAYAGNQVYLLDNQVKQVVTPEAVAHYQPVYSLNEAGRWMLA